MMAFQEVARLIPEEVALILETPVNEHGIESEIEKARKTLPLDLGIMVDAV